MSADTLERLEALRDIVRDGSDNDLRDRFGPLMSTARDRSTMDGEISMLIDIDDDATVSRYTLVPRQRGSYVPPEQTSKYDAHVSVPTDAWLSYDDLRRAVRDDLSQAIEGIRDSQRYGEGNR